MKKRKNKRNKNKIFTIIGIIVLVSIFGIIVYINRKDYYVSESGIDKLNQTIKKENEDSISHTVGWLQIQGTNIDYPIIHSDKFSYRYPAEKESYLWTDNRLNEKFTNNTIVNGHNIFNLSSNPKRKSKLFTRSEELMNFVYYDFVKKNKYMKLTINNKEYLYKIFAVAFVSGADATYIPPYPGELTKEEMARYIKILNTHNIYDYDIDVNENDKILTVTTCTRMFTDPNMNVVYVSGRLLRHGEKNKNYGVKESKNHKIIEKAWEDVENYDGEDEEV